MKIDLLEAKSNFGKPIKVQFVTKVDESYFDKNLCFPAGLLDLDLTYVYQGDGVLVEGKGELPLTYHCTRCATPFPYTLKFSFKELFKEQNELDSEDPMEESNYFFKQDVLNLDKCLLDTIILSTPQNLKCREDCRGVCPHCYANLNETTCDCEEKIKLESNPFALLKQKL